MQVKRSGPSYSDKIQGSPWENPEFITAKVYMNGSSDPLLAEMRYNSYEDEMEFQNAEGGEILILTNKNVLDSIELNFKLYFYRKYIEENDVSQGFFVRLTNQNPGLFIKSPKKFREEKVPTSGYQEYEPPAFLQEPDRFYVAFGDQPLIKVPRGNKKIRELFHEYGFENFQMQRVRYNEAELIKFFLGLEKSPGV
jgi:hypothetical protein